MEITFCHLAIYLIEIMILWLYCFDLFESRFPARKTFLILIVLYSPLFLLTHLHAHSFYIAAFFLTTFFFLYKVHDIKLSTALCHAGLIVLAILLGHFLSLSLYPKFAENAAETGSHFNLLIVCASFHGLIYFSIMYTLSRIFLYSKSKHSSFCRCILFLLPAPIISFFIIFTMYTIYCTVPVSPFLNATLILCVTMIMLLNLMIWFFFNYAKKKSLDLLDLKLSLMREYDNAEYYKMLNEQHEDRSILLHNIKAHLCSIAALAEEYGCDRISGYIDELLQTGGLLGFQMTRMCENQTLNAILCRCHLECQKQNIDFSADIYEPTPDFMSDNDQTALFSNLLDNAREAAAGTEDAFIKLKLQKQANAPYTILSVVNSCAADPFDAHGLLPSRKTDGHHHGFGMKSIRRTLKNYDGEMELYFDEKTMTFHTIIRLKAA